MSVVHTTSAVALEDVAMPANAGSLGKATPYAQLSPLLILLISFAVIPLLGMIAITFFKSGVFGIESKLTLANYAKFFSDETYVKVLAKTIRIAIVVTTVTMLISFPMAFWLAKIVKRYKLLFLIVLFAPYWVNYVIRTYAWMPLLGNSGVLNKLMLSMGLIDQPLSWLLFDEFSVTLVLIYVFLPFGIVPLYLSVDRIGDDLIRASSDLGASPMSTFVNVIFPLSMPGLAGSFLTVFVLTIGAYVTPKLIGGTSGIMFGNMIADQFGATYNWSWGAALATILGIVTSVVVWLISRRIPITKVFVQG
jgi:spermidine/putrescine transport system permease protein